MNTTAEYTTTAELHSARVKWFDTVKGYGFCRLSSGEERDIFIHHKAIDPDLIGYKKLDEGQLIEVAYEELPNKQLRATECYT